MYIKANNQLLTDYDVAKYEIADELGLLPKVLECGWASLTTEETGRIGGLVGRRIHQND